MDSHSTRSHFSPTLRWAPWLGAAALLMGIGAAICYGVLRWAGGTSPIATGARVADSPADAPDENAMVKMPGSKWAAAGIRLEPAGYIPFSESVWRSGRLAINETRLAHISPMAEGVVREVKVRLGQDVKAGDVLAVIDSREVGQAKLDLVKARLASSYARAQHSWTQAANQAAVEMVQAMASGTKVSEIEKQFENRPIGDLRQQLMTAYSHRLQTRAHYESVSQTDVQGAIPMATVIRSRADYEAAEAAYRAVCEEVSFQAGQQTRASEQKLREAQTAESLSKASLMILGFSDKEVEAMDPLAEGEKVSLYPVRAPFDSTVIELHAVLAERVGPQHQMFQLADLSSLCLRAEVPQTDLSLVQGLVGRKVRFRVTAGGGATLEGDVFYTGDVVDQDTRTVPLIASVPNPDRKLKPGTFVEVEFVQTGSAAVQVPAEAIQRQGEQTFVFVHAGGDEFRRVDVKLGRASGAVAEVVEGLERGESVVVSGGFVLKSEMFKDQMVGD
jgi:cobalt-zinc-cadmium efflux system membrane fusion protein